jgi:hypothetical protein
MKNVSASKQSILQSFSSEHVDGMDFVKRLRLGQERNIPVDRLRKYILWYWTHHIRPHFFQEEKILIPWLPAADERIRRLRQEHHDIREMILGIDHEPDRHEIKQLCSLLVRHIHYEENELFPSLVLMLDESLTETIQAALEHHSLVPLEWSDPFWNE